MGVPDCPGAQLADPEAPAQRQHYESFFLGHRFGFLPWHERHFGVTDVLVLTVTYVLGSYLPDNSHVIFLLHLFRLPLI